MGLIVMRSWRACGPHAEPTIAGSRAARLADFMAADLSALDHLVVQIDGLHLGDDLVLVAAIGVGREGNKRKREADTLASELE
ncbi:hypothetical protein ACVIGA_005944 [Bradyrhizobium sp. USDA 3240]